MNAPVRLISGGVMDLSKPHWRCVCGSVAMPLTDDTQCDCGDIYEQEWVYVDPGSAVTL